jgi:hypothetical protein
MNPPVRTRPASNLEASFEQLIDLLADDALDAPRRAALLRSFDAHPEQGGWRKCALALLEAQAWRRAMTEAPVGGEQPGGPEPRRRLSIFSRLAVAAVIAAFAAGVLLGQGSWWRTPGAGQQVTQMESSSQAARPSEAPSEGGLIKQVGATGNKLSAEGPPAVLPDYVRRQLEREGYEVQGGGAKLIPVELPDGSRVSVPVETLKYQYVGRRVR